MTVTHFSICGEFFTDHARARVIEGAWRQAFDLIKKSVIGSDHEIALDVLLGAKRFVGIDRFELVDEDPDNFELKQYLTNLQHIYGGLLYFPSVGTFWKPYAYVTGYGPHDVNGSDKMMDIAHPTGWPLKIQKSTSISGAVYVECGRAMHYANSMSADAALYLDIGVSRGKYFCAGEGKAVGESWVLFRQVVDPPIFTQDLGSSEDPQKVVTAWLENGRHLEERGWSIAYGDMDMESELVRMGMPRMLRKAPAPEEDDPAYVSPPYRTKTIEEIAECKYGWLDREGYFYPCGFHGHTTLTFEISETYLKKGDSVPSTHLEDIGWAKCTTPDAVSREDCWMWGHGEVARLQSLTESQRSVIGQWHSLQGKKIPEALKRKLDREENS